MFAGRIFNNDGDDDDDTHSVLDFQTAYFVMKLLKANINMSYTVA